MEIIRSLRFADVKSFLLVSAFSLIFTSVVASQQSDNASTISAMEDENEWVHYAESQGVKVSYRISRCGKEDVVFLKFENTNSGKVTIEWEEEFWTDLRHIQKGVEGKKTISLAPGVTSESDCGYPKVNACVILARQVDPTRNAKILNFGMSNMLVSKE